MNVVLFLSPKDDRQRLQCMLNTAVLLVHRGQRVICTSVSANAYLMDRLVCQGSEPEIAGLRKRPGLYDLLHEYKRSLLESPYGASAKTPASEAEPENKTQLGSIALTNPSSCLAEIRTIRSDKASLKILRGGPVVTRTDSSSPTEAALDWEELGARWGVETFFRFLRHELHAHAEWLFIDGTMAGESAAATDRLLLSIVDTVVMTTGYSNEETATAYHFLAECTGIDGHPQPRIKPAVLPIPAGIDTAEYDLRQKGRDGFAYSFAKFLQDGLDAEFLVRAEIPRVPQYELREELVAAEDSDGSSKVLLESYSEIANAIMETGVAGRAPLSINEISRQLADLPGRHHWDVFVSYAGADERLALALRKTLVASGIRGFVSGNDLEERVGSDPWRKALDQVLASSEIMIVIVTSAAASAKWVKYEYEKFADIIAARGRGGIIPVCFPPVRSNDAPGVLSEYQIVSCATGEWDEQALGRILRRVQSETEIPAQ